MAANAKQIVTLIAKGQDKMSPMMGTITKATAGLTAAAVALVAIIVKLSKEMAAYGAELYNGASATGMSVEAYQALNYTLQQTAGITNGAAGATRAMNTFMRTAATGSAEYVKVLDQLGLRYEDLVSQSPEEAFLTITDALGRVDDAMQRNIATTTIFGGRYSQQIVAALDQTDGSLRNMMDSFNESGRALTTEQVNALKAYDDALTDVNYEMKKLGADVIVPLLPLLKDLLTTWGEITREGGPALAAVAKALADSMGEFFEELGKDGLDRLSDLIWALAATKDAADKLPDPLKEVRDVLLQIASPLEQVGFLWDNTIGKMHDAEKAADQLAEAERRLGESQVALQIIMVDLARAIEEDNISALIHMKSQLEGMEFGDYSAEIEQISGALHGMSLETIASTVVAYENAIAVTQQMAAIQGLGLALDGVIERLRAERDAAVALGEQVMMDTAATVTVTGSTQMEAGGEDPEQAEMDRLQRIHDKRMELEEEFKQMRLEAQQAYDNAIKEAEVANAEATMENIRAKREANLNAARAEAEAQEELNRRAQEGLTRWAGDFMLAMASGKDAANAWGEAMASQIIRIVSQQAFSMLFALVTGGGSKGVGGIFGSIFGFSAGSGGAPVPHGAAGLQVIPGNPALQTDNRLAMLKSDEMVLSRGQTAQELEKMTARGGDTFIYQDHSLINTADAASTARAIALLEDLDRMRGRSNG